MTYAELVQAVQDYTVNTNTTFVTNIPTFIKRAEENIVRAIPMPEFNKHSTTSTTADVRFLGTPSDFLSVYSMTVLSGTDKIAMYPREVSFMREAYPDATDTGVPLQYAVYDDDTFILAPTPDAVYTIELHYYYTPAALTSSNTTTWISLNATNALLYGTLYHAYVFMKGDADLMGYYKGLYDQGLSDMGKVSDGRQQTDRFMHSEVQI